MDDIIYVLGENIEGQIIINNLEERERDKPTSFNEMENIILDFICVNFVCSFA